MGLFARRARLCQVLQCVALHVLVPCSVRAVHESETENPIECSVGACEVKPCLCHMLEKDNYSFIQPCA